MPGVKGAGGPVPKRSEQRRRQNKLDVPIDKAAGAEVVTVPKAKADWHPIAKRWFEALGRSGQSRFYEPSDWAAAELVAEAMSRDLKPQTVLTLDGQAVKVTRPISGTSMAAHLKAFGLLLVTEGDRRRARLELQRPAAGGEAKADVSELDEYRRRLSSG